MSVEVHDWCRECRRTTCQTQQDDGSIKCDRDELHGYVFPVARVVQHTWLLFVTTRVVALLSADPTLVGPLTIGSSLYLHLRDSITAVAVVCEHDTDVPGSDS